MTMSFGSAYSTAVEIGSAFTTNTLVQVLFLRRASWREPIANDLVGSSAMGFSGPKAIGDHYRMAEVKEIAGPKEEEKRCEETRAVCGAYFSRGKLELRQFEISFLPFKWYKKRRAIKIRIGLCATPHYDFQWAGIGEDQRWSIHSFVCIQNEKGRPTGELLVDPNVNSRPSICKRIRDWLT